MRGALAGDEVSYRHLLVDVAARLRGYYARRIGDGHAATDDLVQETLIALHARRFTYDEDRPFTAWLHAIARYKLIDYLRAGDRRRTVPIDDIEGLAARDASGESEARSDLDRMLETLPKRSRGLVRAVKIEGRSIAEVSAATGLSPTAVKVAVHRAIKRLAARAKGSHAS